MGVRKTSYSCLLLLAVVLAVQIQLDAADDEGLGGFDWCANACELDLEKAFGSDGKDLNFGQTDPSICPDFCIPFLREVFADTPLTSEAASAAEEDPFAVLAEPSNFEDAFKIPARFEESFPSECVDECEFNVAKAFESEGKEIIFGPPKPNTCSEGASMAEDTSDLGLPTASECAASCEEKNAKDIEKCVTACVNAAIDTTADDVGTADDVETDDVENADNVGTAPSMSGSLQLTYGLFSICVALFTAFF